MEIQPAETIPDAPPPESIRAAVIPWETYRQANDHVFPTAESWKWFARVHRSDLVNDGALCKLQGQMFVVADRFNATMVRIGARMAAKAA